jgi:oxygen-independent coproporphyrinogen-3 oxidase
MESESNYIYWREYPDRDPQAVVWYPCTYGPLNPEDLWRPNTQAQISSPKKEIGFYIHVPFCKGLCRYCPFNKYNWDEQRAEQYLTALKQEIQLVASNPYFKNTQVTAGYLGGGTPTTLSNRQLADLLDWCHQHFDIAPGAELTVEATPNTVNEEKLRVLRDAGVNRLSVGVQSFEPRLLRTMGRAHQGKQAIEALNLARKVGFDVLTIDLLYRVPGQTMEDWKKDLRQAIDLELEHLTTFSLFLDPGTPLYDEITSGNTVAQPDEDTELAMYQVAVDMLGDAGYNLYTLYDFARPGKECLHHAINWQAPQRDYVSFGPGAFGYIHNGQASHIYCNISPLDEYIDCINKGHQPVDFGKKLTLEEEMSRYLVLGVNFLKIPRSPFRERFGKDITEVYAQELQKLVEWELIEIDETELSLTEKGKVYLANVSKMFFTEENRGMPHIIGVELQQGEGMSLTGLNRELNGNEKS